MFVLDSSVAGGDQHATADDVVLSTLVASYQCGLAANGFIVLLRLHLMRDEESFANCPVPDPKALGDDSREALIAVESVLRDK